jgi:hypothetical protein
VVESGGFYLAHLTSEDAKGVTIGSCLNEVLLNSTNLNENVLVVAQMVLHLLSALIQG